MKPRIVLSGVNLVEAGPLAVFRNALSALAEGYAEQYELVALVHRRGLFDIPCIRYIEFPTVKASWFRRLHFEYVACRSLSRELDAHLWLSMHDITPSVTARRRAVYCHNPAPFYRLSLREALLDPHFAVFRLLYSLLYRINIAQNDFVIVQQQWLRKEFQRRYAVREVIVAHPSLPPNLACMVDPTSSEPDLSDGGPVIFFYPALPRCFKNAEVLLEAAARLEANGASGFQVWLTMSGQENRYAASLFRRFGGLSSVRWLGVQPRESVQQRYAQTDCLVFPSRLETWGMPISEFKQTGKPMLVAHLPYAHETVGSDDQVKFFPVDDSDQLAKHMQAVIDGNLLTQPVQAATIPQPFAPDWPALFRLLLESPALQREKAKAE